MESVASDWNAEGCKATGCSGLYGWQRSGKAGPASNEAEGKAKVRPALVRRGLERSGDEVSTKDWYGRTGTEVRAMIRRARQEWIGRQRSALEWTGAQRMAGGWRGMLWMAEERTGEDRTGEDGQGRSGL